MKTTFFKIIRFAKPYKKFIFLNIFFNILYALFNALSFVMLIPMLDVMFGNTEKVSEKPVYTTLSEIDKFGKQYLDYTITQANLEKGEEYGLFLMICLVIITFF